MIRKHFRIFLIVFAFIALGFAMPVGAQGGDTQTGCFTSVGPGLGYVSGTLNGETKDVGFAGVLYATLGNATNVPAFCINLQNPISPGDCFNSGGPTTPQITWLLENFPPGGDLTNNEGAARQAAIWYFSDGYITNDARIQGRTQQIIDAVPSNPDTNADVLQMVIDPPTTITFLPDAQPHTFTVHVTRGNQPIANQQITLTTDFGELNTNAVTTDATGSASFTLTNSRGQPGVAHLGAIFPGALRAGTIFNPVVTGKQKLVLASPAAGSVVANATMQWSERDSILAHTFLDSNGNGVQDPTEPNLSGWEIQLAQWDGSNFVLKDTLVTDVSGSANFGKQPPGQYQLQEILPTPLPGHQQWHNTTPRSQTFTLTVGEGKSVLFGNLIYSFVVVEKFEDTNSNRVMDQGEGLLDDWRIRLQRSVNGQWIPFAEGTTRGGRIVFSDLAPGRYRVSEEMQTGWVNTTPGETYEFELSADHETKVDFGNKRVGGTERVPIILVPGLLGSKLANDPKNVSGCADRPKGEIWGIPSLMEMTQYNERIKALWLQDNGAKPQSACDQIHPTAIINKVLFGPVTQDFYAQFSEVLGDEYDLNPFPYDWRLDVEANAQALDDYINKLSARRVVLIGHSMGGLVIRAYVSKPERARKVVKAISVGTPYWGAPALAEHMRSAATGLAFDALLDHKIIWQIIRNSAGAMEILPSDAYFQQAEPGAYYIADTQILRTFDETERFFGAKQQNTQLIDLARLRHQELDDFRNVSVPYYVLAANHKTAVGIVLEWDCRYGTCWDEINYTPGDGTVPWSSAKLFGRAGDWKGKAQVCVFSATGLKDARKEHAVLLSDDYVIQDIKRILNNESPAHCTLEQTGAQSNNRVLVNDLQQINSGMIQISLWGNVRAIVQDTHGNFTGINDSGIIQNDIPRATFNTSTNSTFIVLPADQRYTLNIKEQDTIPVQIHITALRYDATGAEYNPSQRAIYVDIPSAVNGSVTLPIDPQASLSSLRAAVDLDHNGVPDATLAPESILDGADLEDHTRPQTKITAQGARDASGFYSGNVAISLEPTDAGTGILKTEYSLDGGKTWQRYSNPFTVVAEQTPIVLAQAADRAGNLEYPWARIELRPNSSSSSGTIVPLPNPRPDAFPFVLLFAAIVGGGAILVFVMVTQRGAKGELLVVRGSASRQRIALSNARLRLGRDGTCQLRFPSDRQVSKQHAEIRRHAAGFLLYDLNSLNGTYVNGARVSRHFLQNGDEIRIGNSVVRVQNLR